jgi:hypothetical protein
MVDEGCSLVALPVARTTSSPMGISVVAVVTGALGEAGAPLKLWLN